MTLVHLKSWGSGSEGVESEGGITRVSAAGAGGAGVAWATLGGRSGATLVGWKRGCMGPGKERVCH